MDSRGRAKQGVHAGTARRRRPGAAGASAPAGRRSVRGYEVLARRRLKRFRHHSVVAVSLVALLLLMLNPAADTFSGDQTQPENGARTEDSRAAATPAASGMEPADSLPQPFDAGAAAEEATTTVRELFAQAYSMWPQLAIALFIMLLAWGLARLLKYILRKALRSWSKAEALGTFAGVAIFLLALGTSLSVIAGDVRALVGSVGLVGLALSWALQTPIESFTGWLLNSFKGYYQVGDRIAVGEVFGDVYKIDILTTTVWESGGPGRPVQGAQPTGALITFPNSEVLRNNITNYTRDFPFVWDEITVSIANESDFTHALQVVENIAMEVVGTATAKAAEEYRRLLKDRKLLFDVALQPKVYATPADAWTDLTIRYLVPARERRHWASELFLAVTAEIDKSDHGDRIFPAGPRLQVEVIKP